MYRRSPTSFALPRAANSQRPPLTVGIRREDPQRIWERRTPLTPDAVHYLVSQKNVDVHLEHCDRRAFPDAEYVKAGATITPKLDDAHIIIGIKETPVNEIIASPAPTPASSQSTAPWTERTHLMFSHTAKGQPYNTGLLSRFVPPSTAKPSKDALLPRLIDYELLTNDNDKKRTVGFGWFAGVAGALESLSAMAHSHLEVGVASPFLYTPRPHTHPSLDSLRSALRSIGIRIAEEGTPPSLGPFVIGLTGNGNVSQGCLSILSELPIEKVSVKDLHSLVTNKETDLHKIYLVHAQPQDYFVGLDGRKYEREDYYGHPQSYRSTFAESIAPYLTLFLNGTGWSSTFPRLMTNEQLTVALGRAQSLGGARFTNIGDISCDIEGGLQFLTRSTTLSSPFYSTRPSTLLASLPSVQFMSVDILPASLPLDASKHFSKVLLPYMESLIDTYTTGQNDGYSSALDRATISRGGHLMGKHGWLQRSVDKFYASAHVKSEEDSAREPAVTSSEESTKGVSRPGAPKKKKVLMLGSGMVAGPAVDEIATRADVQLLIASNSLPEAEKLAEEHSNVQYRIIDVSDLNLLSSLIAESDIVISLLPAPLHPTVAELCISNRKHLVTASYISPDMEKLHQRASAANVLLLNEIGLDPGIDHCSAISLVSKLHSEGKQVRSFISFCGGLPAPDVPHTPLRYKFSWSPRGVLTAALNSAQYRLNKQTIEIPGEDLLKRYFPDVPITSDFALEGLANRNSLPYATVYELGYVRTILRGTLRYPGFSDLMQSFKSLGLLETSKTITLDNWSSFVPQAMALQVNEKNLDYKSALSTIGSLIPENQVGPLHEALEWLSLLSPAVAPKDPVPMPRLPTQAMSPLDIFAYLLAHKLQYKPQERDMVILSHEVIARARGSGQEEIHTSSLITYGTQKASAMARTVGLPIAFAALNVLDGKVKIRGVTGPGDSSIYLPVLQGLEKVGLGMTESMTMGTNSIENRLG